jgi:CRISPR-associated protein Cmr2
VSGNDGLVQNSFPYDAQYCYSFRLESAIRDNKNEANCSEVLQKLLDTLKPLWRKYGHPCPYGVLLLADGDNMGKLT